MATGEYVQPRCQWCNGSHELHPGWLSRYAECFHAQGRTPDVGVIGSPGRPDDQQHLRELPSDRDDLGPWNIDEPHGRDQLHQLPCLHRKWVYPGQVKSYGHGAAMFELPYHFCLVASDL